MAELQRLSFLATQGDREAAEELYRASKREANLGLMATAVATLADSTLLGGVGADLWEGKQWEALASLCRAFGFELEPDTASRLDALLHEGQVGARVRRVERKELLTCLANARRSPHRYDFQHGGEVPDAPRSPKTMLVFAVCGEDGLRVGIGRVGAKAPNPAMAWPELRPWSSSEPTPHNTANALAWAKAAGSAGVSVALRALSHTPPSLEPTSSPAPTDTRSQLDALLEGPPSSEAFKGALALIEQWPKSEKGARAEGLRRAAGVFSAWPLFTRQGDRNTMKRWEAGKARDTDGFRVALVLDPLKEETDIERLCALAPAPLRALRLKKTSYERLDVPLARLFREATLDALEHLVLDQLTLLRGAELLSEFANHRTFPALQKLEILATNIGGRRDLGDDALTALHAKFALDKVKALHLRHTSIRARGLEGLCRSGALSLESLVLDGEHVEQDGARALATCATLSRLRHLTLRRAHLDDGGIELLTRAEFWPALETLSLSGDRAIRLGSNAARRVCETLSPRLQVLELASCDVDGSAGQQLALAPLAAMGRLVLSGNPLGREGLVPLVESSWLEHVEVLDLSGTGMDDEVLLRLLSRPMKRLKALNLAGNTLTHLGLAALMRTQQLPLLSELSLASCRLEGEALEAFQADGLPSLSRLELSFNPLGDDGAQRLSAAPRCEHLRAISLESTHLTNNGIAMLQASRYTCGRFGGLPGHILAATHEPWMWSR